MRGEALGKSRTAEVVKFDIEDRDKIFFDGAIERNVDAVDGKRFSYWDGGTRRKAPTASPHGLKIEHLVTIRRVCDPESGPEPWRGKRP